MSSRHGRRHRRVTDDDPTFRPPSAKKEEKESKLQPTEQTPVNVTLPEENGKVKSIKPPTPVHVEAEVVTEPIATTNSNGHAEEPVLVIESEKICAEPELEPLVVDSEEQELQFDDNSDVDSHKGSPMSANRCATRRSQTRNIPTPKTPRVNEQNGDDKDQVDLLTEQNGCAPEIEGSTDLKEEQKQEETENIPVFDTNMETPPPTEENLTVPDGEVKEAEMVEVNLLNSSCVSTLSTHVNVGGDVTRDIDLTLPEENSFLNTAKNMSMVDTLRRMSSRRPIRSSSSDYRRTLLKSQAEKHEFILQQQRASTERVTQKRKTRSKTPENPKRFKVESSPGFFSYISSPLSKIRSRFSSGECMSASTPKLTGYREQEAIDEPELSKIEDSKPTADKKRCVIM